MIIVTKLDFFKETSGSNHDVSLTITKCFLCLNLTDHKHRLNKPRLSKQGFSGEFYDFLF